MGLQQYWHPSDAPSERYQNRAFTFHSGSGLASYVRFVSRPPISNLEGSTDLQDTTRVIPVILETANAHTAGVVMQRVPQRLWIQTLVDKHGTANASVADRGGTITCGIGTGPHTGRDPGDTRSPRVAHESELAHGTTLGSGSSRSYRVLAGGRLRPGLTTSPAAEQDQSSREQHNYRQPCKKPSNFPSVIEESTIAVLSCRGQRRRRRCDGDCLHDTCCSI